MSLKIGRPASSNSFARACLARACRATASAASIRPVSNICANPANRFLRRREFRHSRPKGQLDCPKALFIVPMRRYQVVRCDPPELDKRPRYTRCPVPRCDAFRQNQDGDPGTPVRRSGTNLTRHLLLAYRGSYAPKTSERSSLRTSTKIGSLTTGVVTSIFMRSSSHMQDRFRFDVRTIACCAEFDSRGGRLTGGASAIEATV